MKINSLIFLFCGLILSACTHLSPKGQNQAAIIPKPHEVIQTKGVFKLSNENVLSYNKEQRSLDRLLQLAKGQLLSDGFGELEIKPAISPGKNSIHFTLSAEDEFTSDEAYQLIIKPGNVQIRARNAQGLFYGFQSLRQLFLQSKLSSNTKNIQISCVEIHDQPRFKWRGMLLDCCRHFMSKEKIKQYIDVLAFYKMNRFHWHLTEDQGWRIEIKKYPELTRTGAFRTEDGGSMYGAFYTQDDIREIVQYAKDRFIEVIPEIELPGHSLAALASYPQFSCTGGPFKVSNEWGVFKDIYCAGNDSTFIFLKNVFDEVCELFPFEYIHIGGDEAPKYRWKHCEKCQQRIASEELKDEHELQSWFIGQIENYLNTKGKKIIGWDEILEGGLTSGATVQSWRGFDGALEAAESGHDAIVSPTSHAYFDYDIETTDLKKVYSFNPVPENLDSAFQKHILGGECNMWSERVTEETVDKKVFPRLLAMSEAIWSGTRGKPYLQFHERIRKHYPILDLFGIDYGFESKAVSVETRFDSEKKQLLVDLIPGQTNSRIYYTLDGSQPDTLSDQFSKTLVITKSCRLKALARIPDIALQQYTVSNFEINSATGSPVTFKFPYSPNYTGTIHNALTDGVRGSLNFRDGHWQGFYGNDLIATIDLGAKRSFSSIRAGFLQSMPSWIFMPVKISVSASDDGENFHELGSIEPVFDAKSSEKFIRDYRIEFGHTGGRYIRLHAYSMGENPDWHEAAGSPCWLFCDEIILN